MTEVLRGKKLKKTFYGRGEEVVDEYSGRLKSMKEQDIKRLIVQLLIMRILKEVF